MYEARKKEATNLTNKSVTKNPKYLFGEHIPDDLPSKKIITGHYFKELVAIDREEFVQYAKSLLGTPYFYGGTNIDKGLDCSGFVMTVFSHFHTACPRISKDYYHEGNTIAIKDVKIGDILLFTSPSSQKSGTVGHIGIVVQTSPSIQFIHSSSGKKKGVIISEFKGYYEKRFVRAIQVLK